MKKVNFLNESQQKMVSAHLYVVSRAIHKFIIVNETIYGFEYDDLYQEGCIWLCKAAVSFQPNKNVKFENYAEKVVANGLRTYCRLMCAKQKRIYSVPIYSEPDSEQFALDQIPSEDNLDDVFSMQDTLLLLNSFKHQYSGTARLGIEAIEWKVKGYTGAEIAKMYGVKPNLVGAWISRAASKLRQNEIFMRQMNRTVEKQAS